MNFKLVSTLAASLILVSPAFSAPITLDFEGVTSFASINSFYNGGTDSAGVYGSNVGASFGADAIAISNDELGPYYSNAPTAGTVMAPVGADAALNMARAFSSASFYYSASENTSISVFSGLNGAGTLLGTLSLLANAQNGCTDTLYCHWDLASLSFAGEAQSIQFGSAANLAGFDNVSVASVPLPATLWLMVSGLALFIRRKRIV